MHVDIPWQHAVYTRKDIGDTYAFSHSSTTLVKKSFPPNLSVPCLEQSRGLYQANLEEFRKATVLVLVTGKWAIHVSIEAFQASTLTRMTKSPSKTKFQNKNFPLHPYDHLERLGAVNTAECAELTEAYRALSYHCTMASYEAGEDHTWKINGVAPFLSDVVILPKVLDETRLKAVMSQFCKATRKTLKDSLFLAGRQSVREDFGLKKE